MQDVSSMKAVMSEWTTTKKRKIMADLVRQTMQYLESKICKDVPTPPTVLLLCCRQILGCQSCFNRCVEDSGVCPLCRETSPTGVAILGQDGLYDLLKEHRGAQT